MLRAEFSQNVVRGPELNSSSVLSLSDLLASGRVARSALRRPEHKDAADAGGAAEGGGPGHRHAGERPRGPAEAQSQVLAAQ